MTIIGSAEIEVLANTAGFASGLKKGVAGAVGATVAATGGLVAAGIKQFGDFEEGINEVFTLLGGDAPTETLVGIEDQVKNLSQSFGLDLQDAISGTYDAISAGVDTSNLEEFEGFTETAAQFAAAGATDFGTSIDLLTTATNAFGLEASDADKTADTLFATIQGGKTTADELAASLFQVAPVAASTGVSLEETAAGLATLTAQGVPTASAATQLRAAFGELAKTGTKADQAFRDIAGQGFSQFLNAGGSVQEAFNLLRDSADEAGFPVTDLFGSVEAGSAVLGTTGDQADRFASNLENIGDASGATLDAFERMDSGIFASFRAIRQTLLVGLVDIGDAFAPLVSNISKQLQAGLPGLVAGFVDGFSVLADRTIPILNSVVDAFQGFIIAFRNPDITSLGIFGLFEGLGASLRNIIDGLNLGGIFDSLFGDTSGVGEGLTSAIDSVVRALVQAQPTIIAISESIGQLLGANAALTRDVFVSLAPVLADLALTVLPVLAQVLGLAADALGFLIDNVPTPVLLGAVAAFKALSLSISATNAVVAAGGLLGYVKNLQLVTRATQAWAAAQRALQAIAAARTFLVTLSANLVAYIKSINLTTIATKAWAAAQRVLNLAFLTNPITLTVAAIAALVAAVVIAYKESERFREVVDSVWQAMTPLVDAVKLLGSAFGDLFSGDFAGAFDKVREAGDLLGPFFLDLGGRIGDLLISGFRSVLEALDLTDAIDLDRLARFFELGFDKILSGLDGIVSGVKALFSGDLSGFFGGLTDGLASVLAGLAILARTGIDTVLEIIQGGLRSLGLDFLADALEPVQTLFFELTSGVVAFANSFLAADGDITSSGFPGFMEQLGFLVSRVVDVFQDLGGVIRDALAGDFGGAFQGLLDLGGRLVSEFGKIGRLAATSLIDLLAAGLEAIGLGFLTRALDPIRGFLFEVFSGVIAFGAVFANAGDGITSSGFPGLMERLAILARNVIDIFLELAGVIADVFSGDLDSAFEGLLGVGDSLVAAFGDLGRLAGETLVFALTTILEAIGLDSLSGPVESVLRGLGGFVQDAAPVVFETLITAAQVAFRVLAGAVELGIAAVSGLIRGAVALWDTGILQGTFSVLATIATTAFDVLVGVVRIGISTVGALIGAAQALWDTGILQAVFDRLAGNVEIAFGLVAGFVRIGIATVGSIIDAAQAVWDTGILQAAFTVLVGSVQEAFQFIETAVDVGIAVVGALIQTAEAIWDTGFLQFGFRNLVTVVEFVFGIVQSVISDAVDFVGGVIDTAEAIWDTGILQDTFTVLMAAIEVAWDTIEEIIDNAVDAVGLVLDGIEAAWNLPVVQGLFDGIAAVWDTALTVAAEVIETVVDSITAVWDGVEEVWEVAQIEGIFGGISEAWDQALGLAADAVDGAVGLVEDALGFFGIGGGEGDSVGDQVGGLFDPVADLWGDAMDLAVDTVTGWIDDLNGWLGDNFGVEIGMPSIENAFDNVEAVWDGVFGGLIDTVTGWIDDLNEWLGDNFGINIGMPSLENAFENIEAVWDEAWGLATDVISGATEEIEGILGFFDTVGDFVGGAFDGAADLVGDAWDDVTSEVSDGAQAGLDAIEDLWGDISGFVGDLLAPVKDAATEKFEDARQAISDKLTEATDTLTRWGEEFVDDVELIWGYYGDVAREKLDEWKEAISERLDDAKETVSEVLSEIVDTATENFEAVVSSAREKFDAVRDAVSERLTEVRDAVSDKLNEALDVARERFDAVRDAVSDKIGEARDAVVDTLNDLVEKITPLIERAKEAIIGPFQSAKDFVSGLFDGVSLGSIDVTKALGPLGTVIDTADRALQKVKAVVTGSTGGKQLSDSLKGGSSSLPSNVQIFGDGGLATSPGIVGEEFRPELVLPLTKPGRMAELLAEFGGDIAASMGGFDQMIGALAGAAGAGSASVNLAPGGDLLGSSTGAGVSFGRPPAGDDGGRPRAGRPGSTRVDQSVTNYHFHGAEAGAVAKDIRDKRRSEIVEGVRIRA